MAHDGDQEAVRPLRRDPDMHALELSQDLRLVVIAGVHLREVRHRLDQRADEEGQQCEFRLIRTLGGVEVLAQSLKVRPVHLLDIGDVRDVALGGLHLLGDLAAKADDADLRHAGLFKARRRRGGGCGRRRGAMGDQIGVVHPSRRASAPHAAQVDPHLPRVAAHRGRGERPVAGRLQLRELLCKVLRRGRAGVHAHRIWTRRALGRRCWGRGRRRRLGRRCNGRCGLNRFRRIDIGVELHQRRAHAGHVA